MIRRLLAGLCLLFSLACVFSAAKEPPAQVIVWPPSGPAVVRLTLGKLKEIGSTGGTHTYTVDITAEMSGQENSQGGFFPLFIR